MASESRLFVKDISHLLNSWHPTLNRDISPSKVSAGSSRKQIWWIHNDSKTGLNHSWHSTPAERMRLYRENPILLGCGVCNGRQVQKGVNDFASQYPDLLLEWDYEKNTIKPDEVSKRNPMEIHWKHYNDETQKWHRWPASIRNRTRKQSLLSKSKGCSICRGLLVVEGINDLATLRPDIAIKWHPTKNGDLKPTMFSVGSEEIVYWIHEGKPGEPDHEWDTMIIAMTRLEGNTICPVCSNHKLQIGVNDLRTKYPKIADLWHPTKNGELMPETTLAGSTLEIWFQHLDEKTNKIHEWPSEIMTMISRKSKTMYGCSICANRLIVKGINDLKTTHPLLAKQFHPTKNGDIKITQIGAGSTLKIHWRHYKRNQKVWHEWPTMPRTRAKGKNCPFCKKSGFRGNQSGSLYIIQGEVQGKTIIQFGISQDLKNRLSTHRLSGFNKVLATIDFPMGSDAMSLERKLINLMKEHHLDSCRAKGILFDGASEAFCLEDVDQDFLDEFMELVTL